MMPEGFEMSLACPLTLSGAASPILHDESGVTAVGAPKGCRKGAPVSSLPLATRRREADSGHPLILFGELSPAGGI